MSKSKNKPTEPQTPLVSTQTPVQETGTPTMNIPLVEVPKDATAVVGGTQAELPHDPYFDGTGKPSAKELLGSLVSSPTEPTEGPLTLEQQADLARLEQEIEQAVETLAINLREIRRRKLYRATHDTFELYVQERYAKTRQWVTHLTNQLRRNELLQEKGLGHITLSDGESRALAPLESRPEFFVDAVKTLELLQKAGDIKKNQRVKILDKIVNQVREFLKSDYNNKHHMSWEEYQALLSLIGSRGTYTLTNETQDRMDEYKTQDNTRTVLDCLILACEEAVELPYPEILVKMCIANNLDMLSTFDLLQKGVDKTNALAEIKKQQAELEKKLAKLTAPVAAPVAAPTAVAQGVVAAPITEEEEGEGEEESEGEPWYSVDITGYLADWVKAKTTIKNLPLHLCHSDMKMFVSELFDTLDAALETECTITIKPVKE